MTRSRRTPRRRSRPSPWTSTASPEKRNNKDFLMASKADISIVSSPGLASIVVPCCGMLEYTKLCVPSILKHTRAPYELIFLDIGSLDGTAEYLAGFSVAAQVRVEIIRTPTDAGIANAVQRAIKQTHGEYVVLLNNDTIVTETWLNHRVGL